MIDPDEVRAAADTADTARNTAAEDLDAARPSRDTYRGADQDAADLRATAIASGLFAVAAELHALRLAVVDVVEQSARKVARR